MELELIDQMEL